jgi:chloramphenicol-sensitive protein RarD
VTDRQPHARTGLLLGLGAYGLWGVMPLYFKILDRVPSTELVAHRALWSLVIVALLLSLTRRWSHLRAALRQPKLMLALAGATVLIGGNWLIFIWAVMNGHVLEASLGYFLNPLVNVLMGVLLLRERLSRPQIVAVVLAAAGVLIRAVGADEGLWISLTLAFSFALYGFVRKVAPAEPIEGLAVETGLMTPVALAWLVWLHTHGSGSLGTDRITDLLLMFTGVVTAVPLLLFTAAARRLAFSTLGILQYVAPSLQFLIGIALGERLGALHLTSFALIWVALVIFAAAGIRSTGRTARAAATEI